MQIHELNTFSGTPGNTDYLAIDDGSDTSKISSTSLLSGVNARVDNLIDCQTPAVTNLWTGSIDKKNQTANLSQNISNFDFIDIYVADFAMEYIRRPVSSTMSVNIECQNMADDIGSQFIHWFETGLTISGTTATINRAIKCYWDDFSAAPVVSEATAGGCVITRIDGIKVAQTANAEIVDARVGADGVTYNSLGTAIRTQVSDLKDDFNPIYSVFSDSFGIDKSVIVDGYDASNGTTTNNAVAPFIVYQKPSTASYIITAIKLKSYTSGTLSIGYYKGVPSANQAYDSSKAVVTNTLTISTAGIMTIGLPNPFIIPADCCFFIGMPTDTCRFIYGYTGTDMGFLYINSGTFVSANSSLNLVIYGINLIDYQKQTNTIFSAICGEDITPVDGYSSSNASTAAFATSPYVILKSAQQKCLVTKFKTNIRAAGTITIGTIPKANAYAGGSYDATKLNIHETIYASSMGVQDISLSTPMLVTKDDYVFIGIPSDTAGFYYGGNGADKRFLYVSGGTYAHSDNSVNFTLYGYTLSTDSVYSGKTLSILGDSISTFSGYIPEGNATYYPSGTVTAVSDTWWYKLYTALDMTLDTNNSWSGSRVTTTGGTASAGCGDRAEDLGTSPDVIIVWMGINDFNNEVALGTYDGTTAIPNTTTTFREAYAIMLNKILTKYQSSEVWACTLPQCERNADTGFPEINGNGVALPEFNKAIKELAEAFGVKVLDHNKCGLTYQNMPTFNPDNLHPNKFGHSLVANNDIRQMDNLVRTRYATE